MRFLIVIRTTTQQIEETATVLDERSLKTILGSYEIDTRDLLFISITRLT